jgi:hypothetical protein
MPMSDFILEINDTKHNIEIETSISNIINNLELITSTDKNIEITTGYSANLVFASDIIGLDNYIGNFIDTYEIDCGTP